MASPLGAESELEVTERARLPTLHGEFDVLAFGRSSGREEHLALVMGDPAGEGALVRVHSACLTGDILGSTRCDCGPQLREAMRRIAKEGRGAVVYLNQEGRGIGLANKIRAYSLQDAGADTVEANERLGFPADPRDFAVAGEMLRHLGVTSARLLTNNPRKVESLRAAGVEVAERVPLEVGHSESNRRYLATKRVKLGHLLDELPLAEQTVLD